MTKVGQHPPMSEQLAALAAVIDDARRQNGAEANGIADKGARILALAQELAHSIGEATRARLAAGTQRIASEAGDEIEAARDFVRRKPMASLAGAAIGAAILTTLACGRAHRRARYRRW